MGPDDECERCGTYSPEHLLCNDCELDLVKEGEDWDADQDEQHELDHMPGRI